MSSAAITHGFGRGLRPDSVDRIPLEDETRAVLYIETPDTVGYNSMNELADVYSRIRSRAYSRQYDSYGPL
jgi:hypothetical protein